MFPWLGRWDITEGAVRNGPAASGILQGPARNSKRGIAFVETRRTGAKVCAENSSYAPLGLGHFPFHPRLARWAVFSRRSAARIAGSGLPANSSCHAHARVLTLTLTLEPGLILNGLRGAEAPLFHGGSLVMARGPLRVRTIDRATRNRFALQDSVIGTGRTPNRCLGDRRSTGACGTDAHSIYTGLPAQDSGCLGGV